MFAARTFRAAAPMATRAFSSTSRASIAKMTIVGRTGTVPEAVHISNDRTIVRYVIGSPYGKPPNERMSWFRVASFPTSEKHRDYLMNIPKGSLVCVEADARMNVYTDANSQKKADLSLVSSKCYDSVNLALEYMLTV